MARVRWFPEDLGSLREALLKVGLGREFGAVIAGLEGRGLIVRLEGAYAGAVVRSLG